MQQPLENLDDGADLKRRLFYMFQHVTLREAAFNNHPELLRGLSGQTPLPFLHFQSQAMVRLIQSGAFNRNDMADDEEMELFESASAHAVHMHKHGGYTAHIISLPTPEVPPQAHFIAIVHKDDEPKKYMQESPSTRYFTLEKTDSTERTLLCEWTRDGMHRNFGRGPPPVAAEFTKAVFKGRLGQGSARIESGGL